MKLLLLLPVFLFCSCAVSYDPERGATVSVSPTERDYKVIKELLERNRNK